MLRSNWRLILATLGGLAALGGILWGATYGYYQFEEATKNPYASERYQPARDARLPEPRPKQQPQPPAYQPNCQQPQSQADADLCAQWGAVQAVNETNRLTRLALNLATLGFMFAVFGALVGVIGTALIWLAWTETRASNHAQRAWMCFDKLEFSPFTEGNLPDGTKADGLMIAVRWKNVGNSPATHASITVGLAVTDVGVDPAPFAEGVNDGTSQLTVGPGMSAKGTALYLYGEAHKAFLRRERVCAVYNRLTYRDIFQPKKERVSEGCFVIEFDGTMKDADGSLKNRYDTAPRGPQNRNT